MKYLCLVYHDAKKMTEVSPAEMDAYVSGCNGWIEELEKSGRHIYSAGLQSDRTATTVRRQNDKVLLSDGPFAETKEYLGGFSMIEARDLNEALQIASKFPSRGYSSMEVRPLLEPNASMCDPLDIKIAAAVRRTAERVDPEARAKIGWMPQAAATRATAESR